MKCMIPPCHRVYPLLIALGVFALVGVVALKCLANLNAPCVAGPATKTILDSRKRAGMGNRSAIHAMWHPTLCFTVCLVCLGQVGVW